MELLTRKKNHVPCHFGPKGPTGPLESTHELENTGVYGTVCADKPGTTTRDNRKQHAEMSWVSSAVRPLLETVSVKLSVAPTRCLAPLTVTRGPETATSPTQSELESPTVAQLQVKVISAR